METAEKIPLPVSPKGIAEAMELPHNHVYIKASNNVLSSRKVESDVPTLVEEPAVIAHVEEPVIARVEEPVIARVEEEPGTTAHVAELIGAFKAKPAGAHVEDRGKITSTRSFNRMSLKKRAIDTTQPFESVKEAVSRFGGSIDWKARRAQTFKQRPKSAGIELEMSEEIAELRRQEEEHNGEKSNLHADLYSTNKLVEELKQNLEKAQKEEQEATQASEVARLKVQKLEQEIENEAKYAAAVSELNSIKEELKTLQKQYSSMAIERNVAVKMAEEAVSESKKIEKSMICLNIELESLEIAQTAHQNKAFCKWKLELQNADEKLQRLEQQVLAVKDLKSKLDASSSLLLELKSELALYMESKLNQEGAEEQIKVLEEVKVNIEKATDQLNSVLEDIKQNEENAFTVFSSLKADLDNKRSQIASFETKEKQVMEKMIELPKKLEQAEKDADEAKSLAQAAQIELHEAKEDAEQAKARSSTMESQLLVAQTELEDAKTSEMSAVEAIKALRECESAGNNNDNLDSVVTLGVEEYYELTKQAYKAEKQVGLKVAAANSQIEMAKESELNSLHKLEEVNLELAARRESLKMVTEKAEKAQEGKLSVENELRIWKESHELQDNASLEEKKESNNSEQTSMPSDNTITESTPETKDSNVPETKTSDTNVPETVTSDTNVPETVTSDTNVPETKVLETVTSDTNVPETKTKKKKKQLFPKVAMFFAKRKARHNK